MEIKKFKWLWVIVGLSQTILVHGAASKAGLEEDSDSEASRVCGTPPPPCTGYRDDRGFRPSSSGGLSSGGSSITFDEWSPPLSAQVSPRGKMGMDDSNMPALHLEGEGGAPAPLGAPSSIRMGREDHHALGEVAQLSPTVTRVLACIYGSTAPKVTLGEFQGVLHRAYGVETGDKVRDHYRVLLTELSRKLNLALAGSGPGDNTG